MSEMKKNTNAWTNQELKASVIAYFEMQTKEKYKIAYTKAYYYRILSVVFDRSEKSFEFRMQNISHILSIMGKKWISGLKPAKNVGVNVSASIEGMIRTMSRSNLSPSKKQIFNNKSLWDCLEYEISLLNNEVQKLEEAFRHGFAGESAIITVYNELQIGTYIAPISSEIELNKAYFTKSLKLIKNLAVRIENQKNSVYFEMFIVKQLLKSMQKRNKILNKFSQAIYYQNYPRQEEDIFDLWKEKRDFSRLLDKNESPKDITLPMLIFNGLYRQIILAVKQIEYGNRLIGTTWHDDKFDQKYQDETKYLEERINQNDFNINLRTNALAEEISDLHKELVSFLEDLNLSSNIFFKSKIEEEAFTQKENLFNSILSSLVNGAFGNLRSEISKLEKLSRTRVLFVDRSVMAVKKEAYKKIDKKKIEIDTKLDKKYINKTDSKMKIYGLSILRWEKLILEAELFWDEINSSELFSSKMTLNNTFTKKLDGFRKAIHNYNPSRKSGNDFVFTTYSELKNEIQTAVGSVKIIRNSNAHSVDAKKKIDQKNELFRNIWFCMKNERYNSIDLNIKEIEREKLIQGANNGNKRGRYAAESVLKIKAIDSYGINKTRWQYIVNEAESLVYEMLDDDNAEVLTYSKQDFKEEVKTFNLGISHYDLNERFGNEKVFANFNKFIKQIVQLNEKPFFQSNVTRNGIDLIKSAASSILFLDEKMFLERKQKVEDWKINKQRCSKNSNNSRVVIDDLLNLLLKLLFDSERNVVIDFHGLNQNLPKRTFAEIARNTGVSRERIRQLHNRSMEIIRKKSLSVDVVKIVKKAFAGIGFKKDRMNLYSFCKKVFNNSSSQFDPLAALEFLLELAGVEGFLAGNIVSTKLFYDNEIKAPISNIEFPTMLELFYGIGETECGYLNSRFDIILDTDSILDKSIPSSSWKKLEKKPLYDYLRAAEAYDVVAVKFEEIVNSIKTSDGTISEKDIYPLISKSYDLHGVRVKGTVHFLAEICGGLSFDSKHFVWVVDGFTWEDSERLKNNKAGCNTSQSKQLSQLNAAHKILLEKKRPMSTREIMRIVLERNLIKTSATNPVGGLNSLIYMESKKDLQLGRESRFRLLGKGIVELTGCGKALYEGDGRKTREKNGHSLDLVKIVSFAHLISLWLSSYSAKEKIAIQSANGIFENEKKIEEISISEETSLQSLRKLLRRSSMELRQYILKSEYRWCLTAISKIINECGGVAKRNEIVTRIPFAIEINEMRAEGVFNLLIGISNDIDNIEEECYFSEKFEKKVIKKVWKKAASIVIPNTGIYFTDAISELCMSNYYFDEIGEPGETFISACIRTNPKTIIKDGMVKLRRDSV